MTFKLCSRRGCNNPAKYIPTLEFLPPDFVPEQKATEVTINVGICEQHKLLFMESDFWGAEVNISLNLRSLGAIIDNSKTRVRMDEIK